MSNEEAKAKDILDSMLEFGMDFSWQDDAIYVARNALEKQIPKKPKQRHYYLYREEETDTRSAPSVGRQLIGNRRTQMIISYEEAREMLRQENMLLAKEEIPPQTEAMTISEAIDYGKGQLEVFGGLHAGFIRMAIKALRVVQRVKERYKYYRFDRDYDPYEDITYESLNREFDYILEPLKEE